MMKADLLYVCETERNIGYFTDMRGFTPELTELILRENIVSNFYQEALVMFFFFNVTSKDRSLKM